MDTSLNSIKAEVLSNYLTDYFNYAYSKSNLTLYGCKLITLKRVLKNNLKTLFNGCPLNLKAELKKCIINVCKKCEINLKFLPKDICFVVSNIYDAIYVYNKDNLLSIVDYNDNGNIDNIDVFGKDKSFPVDYGKEASFKEIMSCIQEQQFNIN